MKQETTECERSPAETEVELLELKWLGGRRKHKTVRTAVLRTLQRSKIRPRGSKAQLKIGRILSYIRSKPSQKTGARVCKPVVVIWLSLKGLHGIM